MMQGSLPASARRRCGLQPQLRRRFYPRNQEDDPESLCRRRCRRLCRMPDRILPSPDPWVSRRGPPCQRRNRRHPHRARAAPSGCQATAPAPANAVVSYACRDLGSAPALFVLSPPRRWVGTRVGARPHGRPFHPVPQPRSFVVYPRLPVCYYRCDIIFLYQRAFQNSRVRGFTV